MPDNNKDNIDKTDWYKLTTEEVLEKFKVSKEGLDEEEAKQLLDKYGENTLPSKKGPGLFQIIFNQFANPLIYILVIAAIVSAIIGDIKDSVFIAIVILINTVIGTVQEYRAEKSSESLQELLKIFVTVRRNNHERSLPSEKIVPGDIIVLESGNKVPADVRLIKTNNLKIDESLLTGESASVTKNTEAIDEERGVSDRTNMSFAGSVIISGRAEGIVVATALNTEIGKIAEAVTSIDVTKPPLLIRMEKFSTQISIVVLSASALLALVQILRGEDIVQIFFLVVALAVAAIPEGLPAALTVVLSIGMSRMSKRHVIIKKLPAVEALGSCTCIASDKTGTLTVNKQTVQLISLTNNQNYKVTGEGYSGDGKVINKESDNETQAKDNETLKEFTNSIVLSNAASLYKENGEWISDGDAVDIALLTFAYKAGVNPLELKKSTTILGEIPYESERGYSATFYKDNDNSKIAIKGSLKALLSLCNTMITEQGEAEIDTEYLLNKETELAGLGYRVITAGIGAYNNAEKEEFSEADLKDLTFLGFICLIDPLRPEVKEAVQKCKQAGIKVIMVTGDHPATALAIGKDLGIAETDDDIMTGKELSSIDEKELEKRINNISIFARVAPLEKLTIVDALHKAGHYVAVTGDGVNDAPALKKANINIAMGSGTDIAKEVSSIIVTDDNFASIVAGVEEGRFTYDNIRKVIYFLIATGVAELFIFLFALIGGLPIPLVAIQLLWLNLVTNGIQGVALAFEAGEEGAMKRPPRNPQEHVFNKTMIQQVILAGLTMSIIAFIVWVWLLHNNWEENAARNVVLLLMVLFENVHMFNSRSEYTSTFKIPLKNNYFLVFGVLGAQGIHIAAMYIPLMQDILKVEPISFMTWLYMLLLALILILIIEVYKFIRRKTETTVSQSS
jgi:magnesium-transporting ATPase (P-type)